VRQLGDRARADDPDASVLRHTISCRLAAIRYQSRGGRLLCTGYGEVVAR
jgi:hypothetical protein